MGDSLTAPYMKSYPWGGRRRPELGTAAGRPGLQAPEHRQPGRRRHHQRLAACPGPGHRRRRPGRRGGRPLRRAHRRRQRHRDGRQQRRSVHRRERPRQQPDRRAVNNTINNTIRRTETQLQAVTEDQARPRAYLRGVPPTSPWHRRYLDKLNQQEDDFEGQGGGKGRLLGRSRSVNGNAPPERGGALPAAALPGLKLRGGPGAGRWPHRRRAGSSDRERTAGGTEVFRGGRCRGWPQRAIRLGGGAGDRAPARADPAGRLLPRRLTGQAKRGGRPRGPGQPRVTGAHSLGVR
jgi:hypothetical protein